MCNDYGNYVDYDDYLAAFSQTRIPVKWPDAIPNLQPRDDIWPTDRAPVIPGSKTGPTSLRWGFPPAQPKRPPVSIFGPREDAFRSADASYRRPSFMSSLAPSRQRRSGVFTKIGQPWFCFAGLGRPMQEGGAAFTMLTTDPSEDIAPTHDWQTVIVERADRSAWLELKGNEAELLRALPTGSLEVEQVR